MLNNCLSRLLALVGDKALPATRRKYIRIYLSSFMSSVSGQAAVGGHRSKKKAVVVVSTYPSRSDSFLVCREVVEPFCSYLETSLLVRKQNTRQEIE